MKIEEYYTEKYYGQYKSTEKAAISPGAGADSFLSVLATRQQEGRVSGSELAVEPGGQQVTAPNVNLDTGRQVKNRVQDVDLEETYGLVLGTGLSPEAAQKKEELHERLEALCANNPGVYYRLSEGIYQKMADDPEFEAMVYKAINTFEESAAARVTLFDNAINAMYMGPGGDWVLMSSLFGGAEEDSVWEIVLSLRSGKQSVTLEELKELFPEMPEATAALIVQNQNTEGLEEGQAEAAPEPKSKADALPDPVAI